MAEPRGFWDWLLDLPHLRPARPIRLDVLPETAEIEAMGQLHQIHEDDLAELERTLPQLANVLLPYLDGRTRVQLRRVQTILSNVRWNYGPPSDVEILPVDPQD